MSINELYEKFKQYKIIVEGRGEKTLDDYKGRFDEFCQYKNISTEEELLKCTAQDIKDWLISLSEKGNTEGTRNTKLSSIKEIFRYLDEEEEKEVDRKIFRIKTAKVPYKESQYLEWQTFESFVSYIKNIKIRLAVMIMGYEGLRYCELAQIKCEDIIRGYAVVVGKGKKQRTIYFSPRVMELGMLWVNNGRKKIVEKLGEDNGYLLIGENGKVLTRRYLEWDIKRLAKQYNEKTLTKNSIDWYEHLSPHKFRHTCATHLVEQGASETEVRDILGHNDLKTTSRYTHSSKDRIRQILKEV